MPKKTTAPTKSNDDVRIVIRTSGNIGKRSRRLQVLLKVNKRRKYTAGMHGSASFQRTELGTDGNRHESEHVIGYNVYAPGFDRKRGEGKRLESAGLAYLEVKSRHRAHPGTGSGRAADAYRDNQRGILDDGRAGNTSKTVSSAVQYNLLEYAHLGPGIERAPSKRDLMIADISFEAMVRNGGSVTYTDGNWSHSFQMSQVEKAEMLLAYEVRKYGAWPSPDRIKQVLIACGLKPIVKLVNGAEIVT